MLATIPATVAYHAPTIAWLAHVDTSPETSGTNVKPIVHRDYAGGDLTLPGDPSQVIRVDENPALYAEVVRLAQNFSDPEATLLPKP